MKKLSQLFSITSLLLLVNIVINYNSDEESLCDINKKKILNTMKQNFDKKDPKKVEHIFAAIEKNRILEKLSYHGYKITKESQKIVEIVKQRVHAKKIGPVKEIDDKRVKEKVAHIFAKIEEKRILSNILYHADTITKEINTVKEIFDGKIKVNKITEEIYPVEEIDDKIVGKILENINVALIEYFNKKVKEKDTKKSFSLGLKKAFKPFCDFVSSPFSSME